MLESADTIIVSLKSEPFQIDEIARHTYCDQAAIAKAIVNITREGPLNDIVQESWSNDGFADDSSGSERDRLNNRLV